MELVPHTLNGASLLLPHNWTHVGPVFCIPGSVRSQYQGWAALTLTPEAVAVITPLGPEITISLWSLEDVSVIKFDGIVVEQATSVGVMLTPLPYPHGIELMFTLETRLKHRVRLATLLANRAHEWVRNIRMAADEAQLRAVSTDSAIHYRSTHKDK